MPRWLFGAKAGLLLSLTAIGLVLGLYFAWELLYQEPAIVRILTIAKIRKQSQNTDLEKLIRDWSNHSREAEHVRDVRALSNRQDEFIAQVRKDSAGRKSIRVLSETYERKTLEISFEDDDSTTKHNSELPHDQKRVILGVINQLQGPMDLERKEEISVSPQIEVYNYKPVKSPVSSTNCVMLRVHPPVPVCIYPDDKDVFISSDIRSTGIWEEHIVTKFQSVLKEKPNIGVLDLGANIGVYSLVAAGMGHPVVAVEPSLMNIQMFETAIHLAGFQNTITILRNAISNHNTVAKVVHSAHNQGDTRINESTSFDVKRTDWDKKPNRVATVTINNLAKVLPFQRAVMKVDIQGYEHVAFLKADRFLDTIDVPYIFMEWVLMRDFYVTDVHVSDDKDMVLDMIDLLTDRRYVPYSLVSGKKLKPHSWYGWPEDVLWKKTYD